MACAICEVKKPKRFCPAVNGEICTLCCGTGRENTITCPLDCGYLQDAHAHGKSEQRRALPHTDIELTERFLQKNAELTMALARILIVGALQRDDTIDSDLEEALEALVKTYRTIQSGLIYESLPANPIAAGIYSGVQEAIAQARQQESEEQVHKLRDADILGALVFWCRMCVHHNNGRRKSREFMGVLYRGLTGAQTEAAEESGLTPNAG